MLAKWRKYSLSYTSLHLSIPANCHWAAGKGHYNKGGKDAEKEGCDGEEKNQKGQEHKNKKEWKKGHSVQTSIIEARFLLTCISRVRWSQQIGGKVSPLLWLVFLLHLFTSQSASPNPISEMDSCKTNSWTGCSFYCQLFKTKSTPPFEMYYFLYLSPRSP